MLDPGKDEGPNVFQTVGPHTIKFYVRYSSYSLLIVPGLAKVLLGDGHMYSYRYSRYPFFFSYLSLPFSCCYYCYPCYNLSVRLFNEQWYFSLCKDYSVELCATCKLGTR